MAWELVAIPLITTALNIIALYWLKPWAKGYGEEKGKNLARKEDLNEILAEVRAVTATAKGIESKLSGELWQWQMLWTQKKEIYGTLLTITTLSIDTQV